MNRILKNIAKRQKQYEQELKDKGISWDKRPIHTNNKGMFNSNDYSQLDDEADDTYTDYGMGPE